MESSLPCMVRRLQVCEQLFPVALRCQPQQDFMLENDELFRWAAGWCWCCHSPPQNVTVACFDTHQSCLCRELDAYDSDRHCQDSEEEAGAGGKGKAKAKGTGRAGAKAGGGRKRAAPRKAAAAGTRKKAAPRKGKATAAAKKPAGGKAKGCIGGGAGAKKPLPRQPRPAMEDSDF